MLYVGIDIAKEIHEASLINEQGKLQGRSIRFHNTLIDFQKFLEWLPTDPLEMAMEATGHYWLPLYDFLKGQGYEVTVLNPLQTEAHRRGQIRKTKTDRRDSFIIADLLRTKAISPSYIPDEWIHQLREITRFRFGLIDTICDLKRQILCLLDKVFPEFESLFSNVFIKSAQALLKEGVMPEEIAEMDLSELTGILNSSSHGRFGLAKAQDVQSKASSSVGISYLKDSAKVQLRCLMAHLEFLHSQIEEVDACIQALLAQRETFLTTIPGISQTLAATITAEIGDIARFESPEKLAAFAGIDPTVYNSGKFTGTRMVMSKRGSPYLRRALWMASASARRFDPELAAFFQRKLAEGKHYNTALGAVCRRLLNRVYSILKEHRPYQPKSVSL
jgi:transposase